MYLSMLASITAFQISNKEYHRLSTASDSVGHICWVGEYEYFVHGGDVIKADRSTVIDITTGNRMGRSVGSIRSVALYGDKVFSYLGAGFIQMCKDGTANSIGQ